MVFNATFNNISVMKLGIGEKLKQFSVLLFYSIRCWMTNKYYIISASLYYYYKAATLSQDLSEKGDVLNKNTVSELFCPTTNVEIYVDDFFILNSHGVTLGKIVINKT